MRLNFQIKATIKVRSKPDAVVFDEQSKRLITFNGRSHDATMSVVRASSSGNVELVDTVSTAPGARTVAVDHLTHKLYLPNATPMLTPPGERRRWMPGTLNVLVLDAR